MHRRALLTVFRSARVALTFHDGYHAGQVEPFRRLPGNAGAIA